MQSSSALRHLLRLALMVVLAHNRGASADAEQQCDGNLSTPSASSALDARARDVCGGGRDDDAAAEWQERYAQLHAAAARAPSNARILVFDTSGNGGYADRLTGLMTAQLLAMLSGRALALDWPGHEHALTMPHFAEGANTVLLRAARGAPPTEVRRLNWLNANRKSVAASMTSAPLDEGWPERVVVLQSNRGFTQQLLAAPVHEAAVREWGLTARNAQFGCLLAFLFRPTAAALAPLTPLRHALADPNYVTVGVHVRTGDTAAFPRGGRGGTNGDIGEGGAALYASHAFILEYADALAGRLALAGAQGEAPTEPAGRRPRARLLLLGDSQAMRAHALAAYGAERLLLPNGTIGHIARPTHVAAADADALLNAVGEHWLFGEAAAFVYSSHSGFPRTAAARALRDDAIHTCFHYGGALFNTEQPTARECTGPYSVAHLGERHAAGL